MARGDADGRLAELARLKPDLLALQGIDFDLDGMLLEAVQDRLERLGHAMPHAFSRPPNSGVLSGFDLDRNGSSYDPEDGRGYGEFVGQGGIAVLSRFPVDKARAKDFSKLDWATVPWANMPMIEGNAYFTEEEWNSLPLFSVAAWALPVETPLGELWVLTGQSTPPVFDGAEDRNGLRNAAQITFWDHLVSGGEIDGWTLPSSNWVFAGGLNADPLDGDGPHAEVNKLLSNSVIFDPEPASLGALDEADPDQAGDPALDTARWRRSPGPGNLRVDYVLPSRALRSLRSGVAWTTDGADDDLFRHFPVWIDVTWQ